MLDGKIVLVTGATRGIGKAIALTLGRAGATIIGTATTESGSDNISKAFVENQISGKGMKLDVTDNGQVSNLMKNILEDFGSVDILVNNAGITRDNILLRMKEDEWEDIINTNLSSIYKMSKSVLRGMIKKRSGRIISITSVVGAMGNAGQSNYAAAKAGIIGFTKSLAREVGVRGITVNAVAPGLTDTKMASKILASDAMRDAAQDKIPLRRLNQKQEVAQTIHWLLTGAPDNFTGQVLHLDGGMSKILV